VWIRPRVAEISLKNHQNAKKNSIDSHSNENFITPFSARRRPLTPKMGEDKRRVYAGYARTNFGANRSAGCREIVDRTKKTEKHTVKQIPCPKDGATVLKVGGTILLAPLAKNFF